MVDDAPDDTGEDPKEEPREEPEVGVEAPEVPRPQAREAQRRREELARQLGEAEERKLRARQRERDPVWFGLGTFGLVGWTVALPTLLGLALGIYLDAHYPMHFSWTLTLLFGGIIFGCINAWYWVSRERDEIERRRETPDDD